MMMVVVIMMMVVAVLMVVVMVMMLMMAMRMIVMMIVMMMMVMIMVLRGWCDYDGDDDDGDDHDGCDDDGDDCDYDNNESREAKLRFIYWAIRYISVDLSLVREASFCAYLSLWVVHRHIFIDNCDILLFAAHMHLLCIEMRSSPRARRCVPSA